MARKILRKCQIVQAFQECLEQLISINLRISLRRRRHNSNLSMKNKSNCSKKKRRNLKTNLMSSFNLLRRKMNGQQLQDTTSISMIRGRSYIGRILRCRRISYIKI